MPDTSRPHISHPGTTNNVDYLIIGAGVAGLRAAATLADHGDVLVVTKEALGESNTNYAQGGIAVALSGPEDIALHLKDTEYAGDGLVHRPAAEILVTEGPRRVEELIQWGANFDRHGNELLLAREAAHSLPRILHANGDATGAEISRALLAHARQHPRIHFADWTMLHGLIVKDNRVIGATLLTHTDAPNPALQRISARATLIASGGAGQVYSDTTNPAVATGDGIALASQAGAELADMEFYQFHPTALALPGVPRFLLSEALRGEGAYLRNAQGERFMERYHELLELAPRDVVARAIAREGIAVDSASGASIELPVYLDLRHLTSIDLTERFPGISRFLAQHNLTLASDLIPVRPAAHYLMGGIRTDLDGRSSLKGLYAAGEAACTGVHGANRLASNSLLEGLVFGARAAGAILADALPAEEPQQSELETQHGSEPLDAEAQAIAAELKTMMWRHAGLLRDEAGLRSGLDLFWPMLERYESLADKAQPTRAIIETGSLLETAWMILKSALERKESRGAHFREDHPKRNDAQYAQHSIVNDEGVVLYEPLG